MRQCSSGHSLKLRLNKRLKQLKSKCSRVQLDLIRLERSNQSSRVDNGKDLAVRFQNDSEEENECFGQVDQTNFIKQKSNTNVSNECLDFVDIGGFGKNSRLSRRDARDNTVLQYGRPAGASEDDTISQSGTQHSMSEDEQTTSDIQDNVYGEEQIRNNSKKSVGTTDCFTTSMSQKKAKRRYKCEICKRTCSSFGNLKRHMYIHTEDKPFSCAICRKGFIRRERLKEHMNSFHESQKPYSCDICNKAFSLKQNLKAHMNYHLPMPRYTCCLCNKDFKYRGDLGKHMKRVHNEPVEVDKNFQILDQDDRITQKPSKHGSAAEYDQIKVGTTFSADKKTEIEHRCDICRKTCSSYGNLKRHMYIHTDDKPFSCAICLKGFIRRDHLKDHVNSVHKDQKLYSCDICNKAFSLKQNLKAHMNYHLPMPRYTCCLCNKDFKYRGDLGKHMKRVHNEPVEVGKNFQILGQNDRIIQKLSKHGSDAENSKLQPDNHISEDDTEIDVSEQNNLSYQNAYRTKGNVDKYRDEMKVVDTSTNISSNDIQGVYRHKDTDIENNNANRCDICQRTFSSHCHLRRHMVLHSSKLPYTCTMCSKGFARKDALRLHTSSVHFGKKAYECDTCKKRFVTSCNLEEHRLRHSSVRNFPCSTCGKRSKTKSDLAKHIKRKHPEKTTVCSQSIYGKNNIERVSASPVQKPDTDRSRIRVHSTCIEEVKSPEDIELVDNPRGHSSTVILHSDTCQLNGSDKTVQLVDVLEHELSKNDTSNDDLSESEGGHGTIPLPVSDRQELDCADIINHVTNEDQNVSIRNDEEEEKNSEMEGEDMHTCKICDKVFTLHGNLKRHLLTHSRIKPFVCSVCGEGFTRKDGLRVHIYSVHTGYRPYSCSVCQKTFTTKQHLKTHVLCHSVERTFLCVHCNKGFKTQSNLCKHVKRVHSVDKQMTGVMDQERKYVCLKCNKRYTSRSDLKKHTKRCLSNNDRYVCIVCKKDYIELKSFEQHEERHRMDINNVYECVDCLAEFIGYDEMKDHAVSCNQKSSNSSN
ncbi:zinc finger protein 271-like [Mercenaria mercenaria]|uniref:zinc finger protein 271-like n=1 Tax=Mercenaria mercenaria TaxID=6596 RepID=UPI00234F543D|nr:zinc finger protein 271-like [Mercenaria mercenaria]